MPTYWKRAPPSIALTQYKPSANPTQTERRTPLPNRCGSWVRRSGGGASSGWQGGSRRFERPLLSERPFRTDGAAREHGHPLRYDPWQRLNFLPLPHQQGLFRPTLRDAGAAGAAAVAAAVVAPPAKGLPGTAAAVRRGSMSAGESSRLVRTLRTNGGGGASCAKPTRKIVCAMSRCMLSWTWPYI